MTQLALDIDGITSAAPPTTASLRDPRYLFSPLIDFFCLGGGSLLVLVPLLFLPEGYKGAVGTTMLVIAFFINQPHFAYSYQIFYRNFRRKLFGADYPPALRLRYAIAGVVVPIFLAAFFLMSVVNHDARMLAYGGNLMVFFVGWHYVKQGYGMLMLDSVLKRQFFDGREKKIFLANSFAVWVQTWLATNASPRESTLWGIQYYSFAIPSAVLALATAALCVTSAMTLWVLAKRWKLDGRRLPINGVIAYLVSLYAWLILVRYSPIWFLVVPAFHSLQYIVVVWRFETNYERHQQGAMEPARIRLMRRVGGREYHLRIAAFLLAGGLLGFLGFWGVPTLFQGIVSYDQGAFGATMFLFIAWIFINIHHYFLDNVMWRRENVDVRHHLFGSGPTRSNAADRATISAAPAA